MKHNITVLIIIIALLLAGSGAARAQEPDDMIKIGFLSFFSADAFKEGMESLGYVEGEDIVYMTISIGDDPNAFMTMDPEEYMDLYMSQLQVIIDANVDVFVTNTDTDAIGIREMAGNTPIVFLRSDDPVATGAVADLINPGGNMTGGVTNKPHARRLQILTEVNPLTDRVYYLYSPFTSEAESVLLEVQAIAEMLGIEIIPVQTLDTPSAVEALENMPEDVDWIFLTPYVPFDFEFFGALWMASTTHQAGVAWFSNDPVQGFQVSYGPDIAASDRQAARIVDRILRGANPAELPVEILDNYLTINLEAAQAIGLEIPVGVLRQADLIVRPGYFDVLDAVDE
jgi:putative tryptophan/tyrosine transport system substrate-binding protein